MNFYALKSKFREFLLSQGVSSTNINQSKDLDNLNLFTYNEEFKKFISEEYEINLENEYSELAELFDAEMQDGKFVVDEEKANDKEANFMTDMVNGLMEDEEFIQNIDEYAANDNEENSMLDMLSDLFKDKGISTDGDEETDALDDVGGNTGTNGSSPQNTSPAPASTPQLPGNNGLTPPQDGGTKDYSNMNRQELEDAQRSQQDKIAKESQNFDDTISQNEENVAKAKEEYDAAIGEDNIDPALLASREQNLNAITDTDNAINDLSSTISDLETQISSVDSQITSIDSNISALNSALSSLSSAPKDDPKAQAAVAQKRAAINSQITALNSQKSDLETQKKDLETQKTDSETNLTDNMNLLQQLETEKTNIETQILETCNEKTKTAMENYNQARIDAATSLLTAQTNLDNAQNELKEIETHLNKAKAKDIEDEYGYKEKADAFDDNEGFELVKGEGDTDMSYSVIKPKNLDPNEEVPVIVYLHGGGGSERSLYNQVMDDYNLPEGFNGYIICPSANRSDWTKDGVAQDIDQILTTFGQNHKIDANNIVVVGHSMGGTGALNLADNEIFKDNEGYKFSKAAALTGYPTTDKDYEIPVAIYADNTSKNYLEGHNLNANSEDLYVDYTSVGHTNVDNTAFTQDADNDGKADLLEWLFDED